ncbi:unnamed protein product [Musa acuminata subsp. burmannicoides]
MESSVLLGSAIREMERASELTTKLQSLVELGDCSDTAKESAGVLSEELLQACNATLSMLKSRRTNVRIKSGSRNVAPHDVLIRRDSRRNYVRQEVTAAPFNDGHQWRKYGEKTIAGCIFPRGYYRCTYSKDQRCEAKKQVQQQDCGVPSLFLVIYKGEHTCKSMVLRGCQSLEQLQLQGCREYTCNPSFPLKLTATATPPAHSFSLRFDSEDRFSGMNTTRKSVDEGTIRWQGEETLQSSLSAVVTSSSNVASPDLTFLESMETLQSSLSAVHDVDDEGSLRSLGFDIDLLRSDLDDIDLSYNSAIS